MSSCLSRSKVKFSRANGQSHDDNSTSELDSLGVKSERSHVPFTRFTWASLEMSAGHKMRPKGRYFRAQRQLRKPDPTEDHMEEHIYVSGEGEASNARISDVLNGSNCDRVDEKAPSFQQERTIPDQIRRHSNVLHMIYSRWML